MGYSPWDRKESDTTEQPSAQVGVHDVNLQVQRVWGLQACGQHTILNLLPPGGGFSICRVTQRYCVYPLMWEMGPCPRAALDCFSLVSHTLPSLTAAWICPLELREGPRGWMKAVSYDQRNAWHKDLVSRSPTGPSMAWTLWQQSNLEMICSA